MTDSKNIKIAIVLVTSLFFLWGVSYGLIDVMNKSFQNWDYSRFSTLCCM